MAKGRPARRVVSLTVTAPRLRRLYQLLRWLARRPSKRQAILRHLRIDQRTFYRDLEILRRLRISVVQEGSHYRLQAELQQALQRLPLPDPKLTLAEAQVLARGRTPAHRKLARFLRQVLGT